MSQDFKIIETQEQLDSIMKDRLERAKESVRKEYADYETLKQQVQGFNEKEESYKSMIQTLTTEKEEQINIVNGLNQKVKAFETDSLKVKVALENGIPYEMAGRLNGEDEESIRRDASNMATFMARPQSYPSRNQESKVDDNPYVNLVRGLSKE